MKKFRLSLLSVVFLGGVAVAASGLSCKSGGGESGSGGDNGGGGDGGTSSASGGSTETGGEGGATQQGGDGGGAGVASGDGGTNGSKGGSGGSGGGGGMVGGMSGGGGAAGAAGSAVPFSAPACLASKIPTMRSFKNCGPPPYAAAVPGAAKPGAPAWCTNGAYRNDMEYMVPNAALDAASKSYGKKGTSKGNLGLGALLRDVYEPAGYAAAADGEVGVAFFLGAFGPDNGNMQIESVLDYLISRKEIPYTIAVFYNSNNDPGRVAEYLMRIKAAVLPALKTAYPKLSADPRYRVVAGQSTDGTVAYDMMWMGSDVVMNAIGGSPSMVCFGCLGGIGLGDDGANDPDVNDGYVDHINFCPPRPIRWTATTGICDIYSSAATRSAAGCPGSDPGGQVDASSCKATWLDENKAIFAAMKAKGIATQHFIVGGQAGHTPMTWGGVALADQLRWVFKPLICTQ